MKKTILLSFAFIAACSFSAEGLTAQTVVAMKTGEKTTGMTKQCYYDALGNEYTRTISSVALCPLSIRVRIQPSSPSRTPPPPPPQPRTVVAMKTGERTTGMTKQCYYDALGNEYTRTISSVELCPLTIRVRISMR
jgi:hypothetical protein